MANNEHLKILQQGIDAWNSWREANPGIRPDLSWADLSNMSLSGGNFRYANLSWANLSGADLTWIILDNADLTKANLTGADLSEANINEASLFRAELINANLTRAYLKKSNLESAILQNANLCEANLNGANLSFSYLRQTDLTRASLVGADLRKANFDETILVGADFTKANLFKIEKLNVNFGRAKLNKANFRYANPFQRKLVLSLAALFFILLILGAAYFFWNNFFGSLIIAVPGEVKSYVYLDDQQLTSSLEKDGKKYYQVANHLTGDYSLKVYSSQLKDIDTNEFIRYKLFQQTVNITNKNDSASIQVRFDTLYTVKHITGGSYPNISPGGTKLIYIKTSGEEPERKRRKQLYIYDLVGKKETRVDIKYNTFPEWDVDWDIDRTFLLDGDKTAYISAFRFSADKTYLFMISVETGKLTGIPTKTGKKWFSFVPLNGTRGFLYENKIYSLSGKYIKDFLPELPDEDRIYYGGNDGVLYFQKERLPGQKLPALQSFYLNLDNSEKRALFPILSSKLPCLSSSNNAERVAVSDYSGMTLEFFTSIKLWSNGTFVDLTNPFLDGDREYEDGKRFHKTEAGMDAAGRKIVFEYESKIYLIDIPADVTFDDLMNADMGGKRG